MYFTCFNNIFPFPATQHSILLFLKYARRSVQTNIAAWLEGFILICFIVNPLDRTFAASRASPQSPRLIPIGTNPFLELSPLEATASMKESKNYARDSPLGALRLRPVPPLCYAADLCRSCDFVSSPTLPGKYEKRKKNDRRGLSI
jgi:hypothetical protein